jgi:glutamine synthetase
MSTLRFLAIEELYRRVPVEPQELPGKISDFFGQNVFSLSQMQRVLASQVFKKVKHAIENGTKIDPETADDVAAAAMNWATLKGATHYAHWFHPLTGSTAEKHDTFFNKYVGIEKFSGSALVQQEPDGSSFPSGGIRTTFEARGYTAWDPSSPMFLIDTTLCIPTIFVSYTGEALDFKTHLLKSIEAVDRSATAVCRHFDRNISSVKASLGCEQEYFLIDKALYYARPDLVMSGRTVFGHSPARGQQLEDHYFGSIPTRVFNFMKDFEIEAWKLGIPVATRHNEVAPSQFEVAPIYEDLNVAVDHNLLLMDVMERVAEKHSLKVLFHEKPFAGINGSGKHNNWSLITDTGVNLFQPTSSAKENLLFLTFLVNTIKAVHRYADLLRVSIASAGNDYRLGANEAPPAIISVFLGTQLSDVLEELENNGNITIEKGDNLYMKLGIDKIPEIILDNTDRNRTSPFAFTGNKFEFRAVGSEANPAFPMAVLNLIVADQLNEFNREVEAQIEQGVEKRLAMIAILRRYITESKVILFGGDGYSQEWQTEAAKRGLSNIKSTPDAIEVLGQPEISALYARHKICSVRELEARQEIMYENYAKKVQIESRIMGDLVLNHIIPAAISYQTKLIANANGLKELGLDNTGVVATVAEIAQRINSLKTDVSAMIKERERINALHDQKAHQYCEFVKEKYFDKIRQAVDELELLVDSEIWPLPKYRELLFLK